MHGGVDLIEGDPVLHIVVERVKQRLGITDKEVDQSAIRPAVVFQGQVQRHLKVGHGHDGGDPSGLQLVDHPPVEGNSLRIRAGLVPIGEDAGPGNREAQSLKAHFPEQGNVIFVVMVEVDAAALGIGLIIFVLGRL